MKSENMLSVELLRYYQQKNALKLQEEEYNNPISFVRLMQFYNEKINSLRKQLHEKAPSKLQEIDATLKEISIKHSNVNAERANGIRVNSTQFVNE